MPGVGVRSGLEGGVVLIKRGGHVKPGQWALPSGYIEADESVEEAAVREAREETGLEIQLEDLVGIYSFPEGPPTSGIIVFYRARPVGGALRAGDDAVDARVFQLDELPDMPFRTHRQAIQRWLALRQRAPYTSEERAVGFHIREAEPGDADAVLDLLRLVDANASLTPAGWDAARQRFGERQTVSVFVAQANGSPGQVIGFVAMSLVQTLTGGRGWIDDMAVALDFRGEGVGAALLEAALRHANHISSQEASNATERPASTRSPGPSGRDCTNMRASPSTNAAADRCVTATPLGTPVDPDVKMTQASSSGVGSGPPRAP